MFIGANLIFFFNSAKKTVLFLLVFFKFWKRMQDLFKPCRSLYKPRRNFYRPRRGL